MANKKYNKGVTDALRILYTHINTIEYGTGFFASADAQKYAEQMKQVYNSMSTLRK